MLQPFLFVGLGGSGGKTLRAIKAELTDKIELAGWDVRTQGFPAMWQFLHIDTPSYQHREGFNARLLDPSEYLGLVNAGVSLDNIIDNIEGKGFSPALLEEIFSPLPKKGQYRHDVNHSTASYRAVGRTVAIARLINIRDRVRVSLDAIKNSAAQTKLFAEKLEVIVKEGSEPKAIIISSLSGGSGSGQFLDVCEAIKAAEPSYAWVSNQTAILYAPDVFDDPKIKQFGFIPSNNLSAINELVNGYWRENRAEHLEALYNKIGFADLPQHSSALGPHKLYLMGKSNGLATFSSQNDVYFAAASMLAKWAADSTFLDNVSANLDRGHQFRPDDAGLMVDFHHSAPINSLGFARVSLGTDSFSNFAAQRVARSAVSQLLEGHLEGQQSGESDESLAQRTAATIFRTYLTDLNIMPPENVVELQFETTPTDSMSRYEQWALDVQDRIVDASTRYASKYGILVVIEMLRKLKEEVYDFGSAGSSETIDAISLSRNLMKDMQVNLLTPLIQELESMYGNLLAGTKDHDYAQTGENVFRSWPDGVTIPSQFVPAPTVRLLEPHTTFKYKFNEYLGY
jgi:hypothetical protein